MSFSTSITNMEHWTLTTLEKTKQVKKILTYKFDHKIPYTLHKVFKNKFEIFFNLEDTALSNLDFLGAENSKLIVSMHSKNVTKSDIVIWRRYWGILLQKRQRKKPLTERYGHVITDFIFWRKFKDYGIKDMRFNYILSCHIMQSNLPEVFQRN